MNYTWPWIVLAFIFYGALMWLAGLVIIPTMGWLVGFTEGWPNSAVWALAAAIPLALGIFAYFFYRRDHQNGTIQSPSFWRYIRTGM